MTIKIEQLEQELSYFKNNVQNQPAFKCNDCGYQASSSTVLKRHTTTKHKPNKSES